MKILITGCCGFIGFNFANFLAKTNKKIRVVGIDNFSDYYSVRYKKKRLKTLVQNCNFTFYTIDINQNKKLIKLYKKYHFNHIFHFAAQAGVRYSLINPRSYIENNISGFFNILNLSIKFKVKRLFYASSSSTYGELNRFPLKENYTLRPKNIYGLSKKVNEEMVNTLLQQSKTQCIGLRFFTVYGEWGRPDMFIMKYLIATYNKSKVFYLNNYGNHVRDFTYIKDVCKILKKLIYVKLKHQHLIVNICSNKPIKLTNIIKKIDDLTLNKPKIIKRSLQKADILKTHGDNSLIKRITGIKKFTDISNGIKNTVEWFINSKKKIKL
jgi:UDP-glucuronate 4-epimerase